MGRPPSRGKPADIELLDEVDARFYPSRSTDPKENSMGFCRLSILCAAVFSTAAAPEPDVILKKGGRVYFDCAGATQGISVGWVDQYHQATDGQELDLTGASVGRYYLVSTANYDKVFREKSTENNRAWVAFDLTRDSNGNAKIDLLGDSLKEGEGLPQTSTANR